MTGVQTCALPISGAVRSPTFNLLHVYPTVPPVLHADLYRVTSADGLGLEDYEETHVLLVEWADRLGPSSPDEGLVTLGFHPEGRKADVRLPRGGNLMPV